MKWFGLIVITLLLSLASLRSHAQAVPDTSLNQVIPEAAQARADTIHKYDTLPETTYLVADTLTSGDSAYLSTIRKPFEPNPKKAGLYSAIIPGLGQVYNRQYWKAPIVVAIFGVTGYFFVQNLRDYEMYRKAYVSRIDLDPNTNTTLVYSDEQIRQLQNDSKQQLDMTVLIGALGYGLQVMDAIASAHLRNFDISRDISMRLKPVIMGNGAGIGLVMNFK